MLSLAGMLDVATRLVRRERPVLTAGDVLLGPGHGRPLQAEILTHLAARAGAAVYDISAAIGKSRQDIDDCLTQRLVRAGLVERVKRRQTMGGKVFRAWFYRLTPSARQRIDLAKLNQETVS